MKLPVYEDCVLVTQHNKMFVEKRIVVEGQDVSIFNYIVADIKDFETPFKDSDNEELKKTSINAYEMRGLTFVKSNGVWKHFLALPKFFNVNQNDANLLSKIGHLKILETQIKADGSMVTFVHFDNGKILPKTKMSFETDQAVMAQSQLDKSENLREFLKAVHSRGQFPIFEVVSPLNKIVVDYAQTKLQLLQIRDANGEFMNLYEHELVAKHKIETTPRCEVQTFDWYMAEREVATGIEGWIVLCEDGVLRKIKTRWYMDRHHIVTESLVRENDILKLIIEETLDDALSLIPEKDVRRLYALDIEKAYVDYLVKEVEICKQMLATYTGDEKEYAMRNLKVDKVHFHMTAKFMKHHDSPDLAEMLLKSIKDLTLKNTYRLNEGRDFVKNVLKVTLQEIQVEEEDN